VRTAMLAYVNATKLPSGERTWGVVVDGAPFTISLEEGRLELTAGPPPPKVDATLRASARSLVALRIPGDQPEEDSPGPGAAAATSGSDVRIDADNPAA